MKESDGKVAWGLIVMLLLLALAAIAGSYYWTLEIGSLNQDVAAVRAEVEKVAADQSAIRHDLNLLSGSDEVSESLVSEESRKLNLLLVQATKRNAEELATRDKEIADIQKAIHEVADLVASQVARHEEMQSSWSAGRGEIQGAVENANRALAQLDERITSFREELGKQVRTLEDAHRGLKELLETNRKECEAMVKRNDTQAQTERNTLNDRLDRLGMRVEDLSRELRRIEVQRSN